MHHELPTSGGILQLGYSTTAHPMGPVIKKAKHLIYLTLTFTALTTRLESQLPVTVKQCNSDKIKGMQLRINIAPFMEITGLICNGFKIFILFYLSIR